ncbi:hypothetical protein HDU76_003925 [Blyttiomyces sp. JEL0837]|nr:hypothetical protein HDU76_003925 [Blyttiomyces sp. JEL0837]
MGTSTPNEATLMLLNVKMNWFFLNFKERELELEYQWNCNVRYRKANERDFLMGGVALFLYMVQATIQPATRNAAIKQDIFNSISLVLNVFAAFVGKVFGDEHVRKVEIATQFYREFEWGGPSD